MGQAVFISCWVTQWVTQWVTPAADRRGQHSGRQVNRKTNYTAGRLLCLLLLSYLRKSETCWWSVHIFANTPSMSWHCPKVSSSQTPGVSARPRSPLPPPSPQKVFREMWRKSGPEMRVMLPGGLSPSLTWWSPALSSLLISLRICISGRLFPGAGESWSRHRLDNCRLGMSKLYDRMSCQYLPAGPHRG